MGVWVWCRGHRCRRKAARCWLARFKRLGRPFDRFSAATGDRVGSLELTVSVVHLLREFGYCCAHRAVLPNPDPRAPPAPSRSPI